MAGSKLVKAQATGDDSDHQPSLKTGCKNFNLFRIKAIAPLALPLKQSCTSVCDCSGIAQELRSPFHSKRL
ncbi:hypothetical protein LC653_42535 [Nostoc sp. CHAB 5784]|uniref:hypothetical protein n=1 Tax=Nostoc mirabile TaxID=2907820 RepID=UPI001E2969EE|nr:hypothetical protein [Nostoc mirabile]MCC5670294.1 hypothetical protein [Nostoc mirabile CHAB5784]